MALLKWLATTYSLRIGSDRMRIPTSIVADGDIDDALFRTLRN